jgi:mono/diheme cytochrome c family protein
MKYYLLINKKPRGPFTAAQVRAFLAKESNSNATHWTQKGTTKWAPIATCPAINSPSTSPSLEPSAQEKKEPRGILSLVVAFLAGVAALAVVLYFVPLDFLRSGKEKEDAGEASPVKGVSDNTFAAIVEPIFKNSTCYDCHDGTGGKKVKGKFDLTKRDSVMKVIKPGNPDKSEIIVRLTDKDDPMPPEDEGEMLSPADVDKVKAWIAAGGKFSGAERKAAPKQSTASKGEIKKPKVKVVPNSPEAVAAIEKVIRKASGNSTGELTKADFERVKVLSLTYKQLTDVGALARLTMLETLSLEFNQLTNVGALAGLKQLTHLALDRNQLTDISPLAGLKQLQELDIRDNSKLTKAHIFELQKALPKCNIQSNATK